MKETTGDRQQAPPQSMTRPENVYGHRKRLRWIASRLQPDDRVLEVGCGTGYMITLPLLGMGFDAFGIDTDVASIELGRKLLVEAGFDPSRLIHGELDHFGGPVQAVIASEVLEHIPSSDLSSLLADVRSRLEGEGRFFVTVPNGHGWFELEAWAWNRFPLERLLAWTQLARFAQGLRRRLTGTEPWETFPSSLSSSQHVHRFTCRSLLAALKGSGFAITTCTGTTMFAGPISNLLFSGIEPMMKLNNSLGSIAIPLASAFMVECRPSAADAECSNGDSR